MTTNSDTTVYYDPYDTGIVGDPYPVYARLVEEAPLYYNERYDFWVLSRHADVDSALTNWETFSNSRSDILEVCATIGTSAGEKHSHTHVWSFDRSVTTS
jgi:cytochrome P450